MTTIDELIEALGAEGTVFLDGTGEGADGSAYLFRDPIRTHRADFVHEIPELLSRLDEETRDGMFVAGYLTYEAGFSFLPDKFSDLKSKDWRAALGYPLAWFGVYGERESVEGVNLEGSADAVVLTETEPEGSFQRAVDTIKELIHEGDVYQVNHTTRFSAAFDGDPVSLYPLLRSRQPVNFGSIVVAPEVTILSFSPELFFRLSGSELTARPMKGTAPRGISDGEDHALSEWLRHDEKNRAENLMIVDLLRNDLSRVCEPGSVHVPDLFSVEKLPSVLQMTSTVRGNLEPGTRLSDIFSALFPCGSITGAPKIRAMRRIAEIEASPRGVYCGTIGYASPASPDSTGSSPEEATFSVAIRTATFSGSKMTFGAGGGIVWDSDPEDEYLEALLKRQFVTPDKRLERGFKLIETMRSSGEIALLEFHLDRLEGSSLEFGFSFDRNRVRDEVNAYCASLPRGGDHRIRVLMSENGALSLESKPIQDIGDEELKIGISFTRVSSGNPWFRHKTTHRDTYERARATARAHGWFDALLTNERGEVTEGAITNIFVMTGGVWMTPPVSCGLLAGVGRRMFMLETGARERTLFPEDIKNAQRIILTNAVIGARPAQYVEL